MAGFINYDTDAPTVNSKGVYGISSNNSGQGGDYFFFLINRGRLFQETRLLHILLTGSRALNISFNNPIKSKNYHIKCTEHRVFECSKFGS